LGLYPILPIVQTSESMRGQVYVSQVNFILAAGALILIIYFKKIICLIFLLREIKH